MILPYYGEFTVSPVPLELDLNFCSHVCAFCFSNLSNPERTADVPSILRLLSTYRERSGPDARLLQQGYPVLVSNKVDAFANSNEQQALPILEVMTELGIPIVFQTRGGRRLYDALSFLRPAVWYVSFAQLDDSKRKAIEPGAPSIPSRLELVRELKARGHRVVAALNPLVPEWLPEGDVDTLLALLADAGAEGVWIELLHLNRDQKAAMSERQRAAVSLPVLDRTGRRRHAPEDTAHLLRARAKARELGLSVFTMGQAEATDFWKPYREVYPKLFPTTQDAIDHCWENLPEGAVLTFDDYFSALTSRCSFPPEGVKVDSYIRAKAHGGQLLIDLMHSGRVHAGMTWREALSVIFAEPRIALSPSRSRCFAYAAEKSAKGWVKLLDSDGLPYLVFTREPNGTDEYYAEISAGAY